MKRFARIIISFSLVILTLFAFITPAHAASNVCSLISGNANKTVTFEVRTKSRFLFKDYITLKQTKGTALVWKNAFMQKQVEKKLYAYYDVTVARVDGKKDKYCKTYNWDGASLKIKLADYTDYKITVKPVTYNSVSSLFSSVLFIKWKNVATWSISKTKGIDLCK